MTAKDETHQPTHRVYTVVKRKGKEDLRVDVGVMMANTEGKDFKFIFHTLPRDGNIVCSEITEDREIEVKQIRKPRVLVKVTSRAARDWVGDYVLINR
jgi:hypothetical protein